MIGVGMSVGGGCSSCRPVNTSSRIAASSDGSPVELASCARLIRPFASGQTRTLTLMLALRVLRFCCSAC